MLDLLFQFFLDHTFLHVLFLLVTNAACFYFAKKKTDIKLHAKTDDMGINGFFGFLWICWGIGFLVTGIISMTIIFPGQTPILTIKDVEGTSLLHLFGLAVTLIFSIFGFIYNYYEKKNYLKEYDGTKEKERLENKRNQLLSELFKDFPKDEGLDIKDVVAQLICEHETKVRVKQKVG